MLSQRRWPACALAAAGAVEVAQAHVVGLLGGIGNKKMHNGAIRATSQSQNRRFRTTSSPPSSLLPPPSFLLPLPSLLPCPFVAPLPSIFRALPLILLLFDPFLGRLDDPFGNVFQCHLWQLGGLKLWCLVCTECLFWESAT